MLPLEDTMPPLAFNVLDCIADRGPRALRELHAAYLTLTPAQRAAFKAMMRAKILEYQARVSQTINSATPCETE